MTKNELDQDLPTKMLLVIVRVAWWTHGIQKAPKQKQINQTYPNISSRCWIYAPPSNTGKLKVFVFGISLGKRYAESRWWRFEASSKTSPPWRQRARHLGTRSQKRRSLKKPSPAILRCRTIRYSLPWPRKQKSSRKCKKISWTSEILWKPSSWRKRWNEDITVVLFAAKCHGHPHGNDQSRSTLPLPGPEHVGIVPYLPMELNSCGEFCTMFPCSVFPSLWRLDKRGNNQTKRVKNTKKKEKRKSDCRNKNNCHCFQLIYPHISPYCNLNCFGDTPNVVFSFKDCKILPPWSGPFSKPPKSGRNWSTCFFRCFFSLGTIRGH